MRAFGRELSVSGEEDAEEGRSACGGDVGSSWAAQEGRHMGDEASRVWQDPFLARLEHDGSMGQSSCGEGSDANRRIQIGWLSTIARD